MNVPKPIHKCLLSLGYRPARAKNYCKFLPDKPVAQWVEFNDQQRWNDEIDGYEQFFLIELGIWFPRCDGGFTSENYGWCLCADGTMQKSSGFTKDLHIQGYREGDEEQAVEVLRANLELRMAELIDYERWLALVDFQSGISSELPAKYAHLQSSYTKSVIPKGYPHPHNLSPFSETYRRIQEIENNAELMRQINDFIDGKITSLPTELEYAAFCYEYRHRKKIGRYAVERFYDSRVTKKFHYLLLAEHYDDIKKMLEQYQPTKQNKTRFDAYERAEYRYMQACAEQQKIIVTDESREWAEKKKLIAPNTWESVPESAFADADSGTQESTATMADNLYAIFFSNKKALASYVLTRHGVDINKQRGEKVTDALDAAESLDADQFVVRSPRGRWCVLMGSIDHILDDSCGDIAEQLSAVSEKDEVLLLTSNDTSGGLWFEYHKNGTLKRRWVCACGEVEQNEGKPLNDFDAKTFGTAIDEEEGAPDTDVLVKIAELITGLDWDALAATGTVYRQEQGS